MKSNTEKLTPKMRQCALLIASGCSQRLASAMLKLNPQTVCAWTKKEAFNAYVEEQLAVAEGATTQALQALRLKAIANLSDLLDSGNHQTRLKACQMILENSIPKQTQDHDSPWQLIQGILDLEKNKAVSLN